MLLNFKEAYNLLQRGILQGIIQERLPSGLSSMIRVLLSPMIV